MDYVTMLKPSISQHSVVRKEMDLRRMLSELQKRIVLPNMCYPAQSDIVYIAVEDLYNNVMANEIISKAQEY